LNKYNLFSLEFFTIGRVRNLRHPLNTYRKAVCWEITTVRVRNFKYEEGTTGSANLSVQFDFLAIMVVWPLNKTFYGPYVSLCFGLQRYLLEFDKMSNFDTTICNKLSMRRNCSPLIVPGIKPANFTAFLHLHRWYYIVVELKEEGKAPRTSQSSTSLCGRIRVLARSFLNPWFLLYNYQYIRNLLSPLISFFLFI